MHDRHEGRDRIEAHLRIEVIVDGHEANVPHHDRVAIGACGKSGLRADIAIGAGTIFDIERLADIVLQLGREDASKAVGHAARRRRHQDSDLAIREIIRLGCCTAAE